MPLLRYFFLLLFDRVYWGKKAKFIHDMTFKKEDCNHQG